MAGRCRSGALRRAEVSPMGAEVILETLAARLEGGGEVRAGQIAMAEAVAQAVRDERPLVAQAGTDTGKTWAYLTGALLGTAGGKVVEFKRRRLLSSACRAHWCLWPLLDPGVPPPGQPGRLRPWSRRPRPRPRRWPSPPPTPTARFPPCGPSTYPRERLGQGLEQWPRLGVTIRAFHGRSVGDAAADRDVEARPSSHHVRPVWRRFCGH